MGIFSRRHDDDTSVNNANIIQGVTISGNSGIMQIQQDCIGSTQVATQPFSNYLTTRDTSLKDEIIDELLKKFTAKPVMLHNCNNCGGQLEMKENEHIFKCPYCGAVYFIGTEMINHG